MARIDLFEMERMQSLYWHRVEYDLSESGVVPMTLRELLGPEAERILEAPLGYPLSEGAEETRAAVASWYPGASTEHVTLCNGGSEANLLVLWTLLEPGDRLAFMVPNYLQGWGLGRHFGEATDTFGLRREGGRWALDLESLERAVTERTKVVMVCNPNNPTGAVLTEAEMEAVIEVADRVGAWVVADEIYRGAELEGEALSPTFFGRAERVVITSGLSKAFGMPGLRSGWIVAPPELVREIWVRHDYTTLTASAISDRVTAVALRDRERVFARTRGIVRGNLPIVRDWVAEHRGLSFIPPVAGAIAYLGYDLPIEARDLAERLRVEQSVLVVPADMFGLSERAFRIGFGSDPEYLRKGLERIGSLIRELG
ncbi:MAG: aminotransferase [Actinomycetota bacterium]|nr:MAG: aminotransferase [Actinomycetota bacterium]